MTALPSFLQSRVYRADRDLELRYDGPIPPDERKAALWGALFPSAGENTPEQVEAAVAHFKEARHSALIKRKTTWETYQNNLGVPSYDRNYRYHWQLAKCAAMNSRLPLKAWQREGVEQ